MNRPKKSEAREKYLEVSKKLFIKYGYQNTSIRMIGNAVGYNQSNFYTYWGSKKDLFYEITSSVTTMTILDACKYPVEFAMIVEKTLSEDGTLIKKLSELSPELLVAML